MYPLDWAVGVFRSPSTNETVVISNDGSGYVPKGVFLPRSVRLLVADPLVDKVFRDRWFGWADPARVLTEYAGLRACTEWKLVAGATTGSVDALREGGVDHSGPVTWARSPAAKDWTPPVLDDMHVHRLQLEYPDLYERLERLADADSTLRERVMLPVSVRLMQSVKSQAGVQIPPILQQVVATLGANEEPSATVWEKYAEEDLVRAVTPGAHRPGGGENAPKWPEDATSDREYYRLVWFVARTMEHIGGWADRPLPLSDMVYAAAAIGTADIRDRLEPSLRDIENEIGRP